MYRSLYSHYFDKTKQPKTLYHKLKRLLKKTGAAFETSNKSVIAVRSGVFKGFIFSSYNRYCYIYIDTRIGFSWSFFANGSIEVLLYNLYKNRLLSLADYSDLLQYMPYEKKRN